MAKRALCSPVSAGALGLAELKSLAANWLLDCEIREVSRNTIATRRLLLDKLVWFLRREGLTVCDTAALRGFLHYVRVAHEEQGGRWGNPRLKKPLRPRTLQTYFVHLKTFFAFAVAEGAVEADPMAPVRPAIARPDQVRPYTPEELAALLAAAKRTRSKERDLALVLFLLDTGARCSEVTELKVEDVDLGARSCTVMGKGNKKRALFFGKETTRCLWAYLRAEPRDPDDHLFLADRGTNAGQPLTRSGVLQIIRRLGKVAGLQCKPTVHRVRHSFAVQFLKAGGNSFILQHLLGHTSQTMTARYVQFSTAERLQGRSAELREKKTARLSSVVTLRTG
jgi:site-specific recombinase XerD